MRGKAVVTSTRVHDWSIANHTAEVSIIHHGSPGKGVKTVNPLVTTRSAKHRAKVTNSLPLRIHRRAAKTASHAVEAVMSGSQARLTNRDPIGGEISLISRAGHIVLLPYRYPIPCRNTSRTI